MKFIRKIICVSIILFLPAFNAYGFVVKVHEAKCKNNISWGVVALKPAEAWPKSCLIRTKQGMCVVDRQETRGCSITCVSSGKCKDVNFLRIFHGNFSCDIHIKSNNLVTIKDTKKGTICEIS